MWQWSLFLTTVLCATGELNKPNFPGDLYPKDITRSQFRQQCPSEFHKLEFCIPKYEDCFGQLREVMDCNKEFKVCADVELGENEDPENAFDACTNYSLNARFYVWTHGASLQRIIIEKRRASIVETIRKSAAPIKNGLLKVARDCGVEDRLVEEMKQIKIDFNISHELEDLFLPFVSFHLVEPEMNRWTKGCRMAVQQLEKVMEITDAVTAKDLHYPYELSYIGTRFGPIGKVLLRLITDEACEKASLEFNHQSVIHINCYDQQLPMVECDTKYIESLERILATMDFKKARCKVAVDLIQSILPIRALQFYKEANTYDSGNSAAHFGGKFEKGFSGFVNGSMTSRDTKSTFVTLASTGNTPIRLLGSFEKVASECGSARRSTAIISSCGFTYVHCLKYSQLECSPQLSICLSDIENMTEKCQKAIQILTDELWPTVEKKKLTSSDDSSEKTSRSYLPWILGGLCYFIVMIVIVKVGCMVFVRKRNGLNESQEVLRLNSIPQPMDNNRGAEEAAIASLIIPEIPSASPNNES